MKDIKIIIAAHKKYQTPKDSIYLPLHVGAAGKDSIGFQGDDSGENISTKNPFFCELTGIYWAWKNLKCDFVGLVHYRRYFSLAKKIPKTEDEKFNIVLSESETNNLLNNCDIILPKKRNYYIENIYSHYKHTMHIEPLDETGKIISEKYPEYVSEFEALKRTTKMHAFNMFIMKKEIFDSYCQWLFDILFELEKRVDVSQYDSFHARLFGRISERLLDVWLKTNNLQYKEVKVIDMQNINWTKKIFTFLIAKFTGKKYKQSF